MTETARLLNISNHGALIESPLAVKPDSMQSVQLTMPSRSFTSSSPTTDSDWAD